MDQKDECLGKPDIFSDIPSQKSLEKKVVSQYFQLEF